MLLLDINFLSMPICAHTILNEPERDAADFHISLTIF